MRSSNFFRVSEAFCITYPRKISEMVFERLITAPISQKRIIFGLAFSISLRNTFATSPSMFCMETYSHAHTSLHGSEKTVQNKWRAFETLCFSIRRVTRQERLKMPLRRLIMGLSFSNYFFLDSQTLRAEQLASNIKT